jgi:TolA-binding protein
VRTFVAGLLLAGCSGLPLPSDMEQAQKLEAAGPPEQALAAWSAIRAGCATPDARPHDDCGLAAVREAQLYERVGRDADAAAAWEALPSRTRDPRKAARALTRAAEIVAGKLGDPARGANIAWRCVEKYPEEVPADDALAIALRIERARDGKALIDRLDTLAARYQQTEIADNLLFEAAVTALAIGDRQGALARWDDLARRFPRSPLADDANWRAAAQLRENKDFRAAVRHLERILQTRKDALIVGSYNSLYLDDAQLLVGQIQLDDLHDPAQAIRAFALLADDYPDSTLRDDALFELARAHLAAHTPPGDADRDAACRALARLLARFPDGNRARAARDRRAELACPAPAR